MSSGRPEDYRLAGEPTGEMTTLDGQATYFKAGPAAEEGVVKKTIVVFTDAFGLEIPNTQILADVFSERLGIDVYVPNFYAGSKPPFDEEEMLPYKPDEPGTLPLYSKSKGLIWLLTKRMPRIFPHRASILTHKAETFLKNLKEKGYTKIGVLGYTLGGTVCVRLATTDLATTAVLVHPGEVNQRELQAIKIPTCWLLAEEDMWLGPGFKEKCEGFLRANGKAAPYEFHEYPGTTHGFALRPNTKKSNIMAQYEAAKDEALKWFQTML